MNVSEKEIENVCTGILRQSRDELKTLKFEDLERFWYFKYDHTITPALNLYEFHKMLGLYGSKCRQWEEMHNGYQCVVERVRDTYLMPKIKEFIKSMEIG
jgi:hypothetical protein